MLRMDRVKCRDKCLLGLRDLRVGSLFILMRCNLRLNDVVAVRRLR